MNNFNDYYNYMTLNKDMNNYNNLNGFDSVYQNTFMNMENTPKLYSPNEGFTKGNMYVDLYQQYKNYKPKEIKATSERDSLLQQIQMYKFAMNDLNLYLDVNPKNNSNLIKLYNDYLLKSKELVNRYENAYGPICSDSIVMPTNDFIWNNSPWPWEVSR